MIEGVMIKELVTHADERGYFRELIRETDDFFEEGFGQWSHSLVNAGVAKAWHIHKLQIDWWYVACGLLKVALHDTRPESKTYRTTMELLLGDHQPARILRVPPGAVARNRIWFSFSVVGLSTTVAPFDSVHSVMPPERSVVFTIRPGAGGVSINVCPAAAST